MSSPSCPKCDKPLSTYLYPDNKSERELGFICYTYRAEWFTKDNVLKSHDGATFKHKGTDYYEALPIALKRPTFKKVKQIADLERGDQLVWNDGFEHHAIVTEVYMSSYVVIHFAKGNDTDDTELKLREHRYLDVDNVELATFGPGIKYNPLVIISRALHMFQHKEDHKYDILYYNCESFANFCSTGVGKSFQAEESYLKIATRGLTTGVNSSYRNSCGVS